MKWKDYDQSIEVLDAEASTIVEKLSNLDPTTDEYHKAAMALKAIEEAKQTEVRNKSEHLNGLVPTWLTGIAGFVFSVFAFRKITKLEEGDGVFSPQALNVWDKVIRKF